MNVEQRHDTQRNICLGKCVCVRDIGRGYGQVKMPQRNTLRPPRASAGVQDQGNVVCRRLGCGNTGGSTHQMNIAILAHFHREDRNLAVRGGAAYEFRAYRGAKQNTGIGVTKEKMKLLIGISRVQRGCGAGDGGSEKAHNRRQSVGQRNRDSIATANARAGQSVRHRQDLLPERIVGDTDSKLGNDNCRVAVSEMQNVKKGVDGLQCHSLFPLPPGPWMLEQSCLPFEKTFTTTKRLSPHSPALSSRTRENPMNQIA